MNITFTWNDQHAHRQLTHYRRQWGDFSRPFAEAKEIVQESIRQNYLTEGHGTFPPRKKAYQHPMLRQSGHMMAAQLAAAREHYYTRVGGEHVLDFSGVVNATHYSKFHHSGAPGINLPARPTVHLSEKERARIKKLLTIHIFAKK